jgi:glutamyl-tRNA reductase
MNLQHFFVAGINYKKTDASVRGQYAISPEQYASLLQKAALQDLKEIFILSTCNRTEIYGLAPDAGVLINLLCSETAGDSYNFLDKCYLKKGQEAVEHIFSVGAGLDSQILGDYEIVGQMKLAVKFSKERGFIGPFIERLFNTVLQSSKAIKNQTELSGGTVSVAFAAIQFIKQNIASVSNKNILLLGTGKIGKNTCKNLVDYLSTTNITIVNRTEEKAVELASQLNLKSAPYAELATQLQLADIVIVATNAEEPVIKKSELLNSSSKLLIDLSIPNNIESSAKELSHITLANVDELSKINDATLQKRMQEVPKAIAIIKKHIAEFYEWHCLRKHASALKSLKQKLHDLHQCNLFLSAFEYNPIPSVDAEYIQKVVNEMAVKMRQQHTPGCNYIEAINTYIAQPVLVN